MGLTREEALKIMGLEEGCTTKEIRDRFKKLALKWHPDKNIDNPDDAQKKFQAISAAYTKLVSSDSEEEDDDIPNDALREMFARIWQSHNRGAFSSDPHLFCDCDVCQADWEDLSLDDFIGSDSDPDDDFYYDDSLYADDLLRQFGEKLYRKYNEPSARAEKKAKQMWTGSGYRQSMTAEEASRNAEELLDAEEREKKAAEKKKKRNRKKKESKKRRKAKQEDSCTEETPPPEDEKEEEEEEVVKDGQELKEEKKELKIEAAEEGHNAHSKDKTKTFKQADVVDSKEYTSDKASGRRSEATKRKSAVSTGLGQPASDGAVSAEKKKKKKGTEYKEEAEDKEESISSEDELDYSSAFLSRARVLAEGRGPKSKDKKNPPADEKWQQESRKKKNITEQKTDTTKRGEDPGFSDVKPKRNTRFKNRQQPQQQMQQGRNPRTANRGGPGHSKQGAGINGSAPVITAANGHEEAPVAGAVEEEEEEDDLSPVDMTQAKLYEADIPQSKLLAGEGNRAAKAGEFEEAVLKYSEAISLYPFDHRYFGNRSFCYDYLQDYAKALRDANSALRIDTTWAKGFYRRGRGLAGLKRYEAAVTAFTRALDLNPEYAEAREQLEMVQLEQLQGMGFPLEASRAALAEYHTVPAAVEAIVRGGGGEGGGKTYRKQQRPDYTPVYNHSGFEIPPRMLTQTIPPKNCSLWVGNINSCSLTQSMVANLFQKYGQVLSVRMLYERRCAFVNYARPESAAVALKKLQGHTIAGCILLLRFPENNQTKPSDGSPQTSAPPPPPRAKRGGSAAAGGAEECPYWRSSGCYYGDQCRYLHLPERRGVDSGYHGDHPSP